MISIPRRIKRFAQRFNDAHHELSIVGGAVRDSLLGRTVSDYDFATSATPHEVQKLFRNTIPTGIQHGTVTVLFEGNSYEVTTYRVDGKYEDHRRPESVRFTRSLEEDLQRRDFTINAIAADPGSGRLTDPFGGRHDLEHRTIRTVGDPADRFGEDALRMLRAVRFAATLQFEIAPETFHAIEPRHSEIAAVAPERIFQELTKMMSTHSPARGWHLLKDSTLLSSIAPELLESTTMAQHEVALDDLFAHLAATCDCTPAHDEILRWAGLLHDVGKPRCAAYDDRGLHFHGHDATSAEMAEGLLRRLRAPRRLIDSVAHVVRHHMFGVTGGSTDAAIRRFVSRVGADYALPLVTLRRADICGKTGTPPTATDLNELERRIQSILTERTALTPKDLAINGNDLMSELELVPGPHIGIILGELLETVLDDPTLNTREQLLHIARRFAESRLP
ncbi:MAG TPA: CCA tRNA nucleotidyltransferase [Alkalispirochaeta sp.]|nr:CCA tRNA nucleotidyltransferase [Alkalispirochaeta sp.]